MSPEFQSAPVSIASAAMASPLGGLEIAVENDAIAALNWIDPPEAPAQPEHPVLRAALAQLDAYFAGTLKDFDLPLAAKGDPFERAVWDAMLGIDYGRTLTYGDIAAATAHPAQAVGGACGRNPIPIFIPCHRVVGAGMRLTGYSGRGGVETKRWLLAHEGALLL